MTGKKNFTYNNNNNNNNNNTGTTENSHIGHGAHTSERTNVKCNTIDVTLEVAFYALTTQ
jgi:hypothetical protein